MRIRIDLAYDGTDFRGWARQPSLRTVQGELEDALATVLRIPAIAVTCAGRTDTGVHARGQVVHLDVEDGVLEAVPGRSPDDPPDGAAAAAQRGPARRRAGTPGGRRTAGLRRTLLRDLAALCLPGGRRRRRPTR